MLLASNVQTVFRGHELADPEDASTDQGEPDQTKFHTAEQVSPLLVLRKFCLTDDYW